ncbi:MAG: ATP-binding cassette domain-containing protein, partial [Verrucomicrobia bacterium]|nr:ATP-binding cassette domain-containing protein [Verrucomicrobiota bacterium]
MGWLLEIRDITKSFSGVPVLNGVSLSLQAGEIHALVGENGAGKSTLMKVVAGLHQPDAGELRLDGNPTRFRSPHEALQA